MPQKLTVTKFFDHLACVMWVVGTGRDRVAVWLGSGGGVIIIFCIMLFHVLSHLEDYFFLWKINYFHKHTGKIHFIDTTLLRIMKILRNNNLKKWEIVDHKRIFNPVTGVCGLCTFGMYLIAFAPQKARRATLNKSAMLFCFCRNRRKMPPVKPNWTLIRLFESNY